MRNELLYEDLIERMKRLDEDVYSMYDDGRRLNCVIVGGSALILLRWITRATTDADVINCSAEIIPLLKNYNFDIGATAYIDNFPADYEDRLKKVEIDTKTIDYYTISLEDVVIAKLCVVREKDLVDITEPRIINNIDWKLLEKLSIELKHTILNDRLYSEFSGYYSDYVRRYRKNA